MKEENTVHKFVKEVKQVKKPEKKTDVRHSPFHWEIKQGTDPVEEMDGFEWVFLSEYHEETIAKYTFSMHHPWHHIIQDKTWWHY